MSVIRSFTIAILIIFAAFFLAMGVDIPVPHLPWRGMAARDIPVGILLVLAAMAVARFWTVPEDEDKLLDEWKHRKTKK
ncbi:MAG TPA: hypothetical protein VGJ21_21075 [Terracidiphilus sp.]|jgi:hypothetical protein